jgi:hypothetical protein
VDVCAECVDEPALQEFIRNNAVSARCDFCGRESNEAIACDYDDFKEVLAAGIEVDWEDALNFMPRDGANWALEDAHTDIYDLLTGGDLDVELGPNLFQQVVDDFADISYAPRYFFGLAPEEVLAYGWDAFVEHVSHRARFFFATAANAAADHDSEGVAPADMMTALGRLIAERARVRPLPAGTELYRGRLHRRGDAPPAGAQQLGTPPVEFARISSRMSPHGIPMFYAALDERTAVAETVAAGRSADQDLTLGVFHPTTELQVVDLVEPPQVISRFVEDPDGARPGLRFLQQFVEDVRRPIVRDEREHLEYVPTQIVTEYFRHVYEQEYGQRVDGITYRSAARPEGVSVVLFIETEDCLDESRGRAGRELVLKRQFSTLRASP